MRGYLPEVNGHVGEIRTLVSAVLFQCLRMSCRGSCGLSWKALPVGLLFSAAAGLAAIVCKTLLWEGRRVIVVIAELPVDPVTMAESPVYAVTIVESPVDPVTMAESPVDVVAMAESPVDAVTMVESSRCSCDG